MQNLELFKRIDLLRKKLNITQKVIAEKSGISPPLYTMIKNGEPPPPLGLIKFVFQEFKKLNPHWLFFDEGEMFLPEIQENVVQEGGENDGKRPINELQTLFNEASQRSPEEQEAIANMLKGMLQLTKK